MCVDGVWDKTGFECLSVGSSSAPVRKMMVISGNIWCATGNMIKILNPGTREIEDLVTLGTDEKKMIIAMVCVNQLN